MSYWPEMGYPVLDCVKAHIFSHLGVAQRIIKTKTIPYMYYVVSSSCSFISSLQCSRMNILFLC